MGWRREGCFLPARWALERNDPLTALKAQEGHASSGGQGWGSLQRDCPSGIELRVRMEREGLGSLSSVSQIFPSFLTK